MKLKDLPIGSVIYDKKSIWNDKNIKWLLLSHGHFKENSSLLFAKDVIGTLKIFNDNKTNKPWNTSNIRTWLRNDFFNHFSDLIKKNIIEVTTWSGTDVCDDETVFFLSKVEITGSNSQITGNHGRRISVDCNYFSTESKKTYWTRSPYYVAEHSLSSKENVLCVNGDTGNIPNNHFRNASSEDDIRPCFNLLSDVEVKQDSNGEYFLIESLKFLLKQNNQYYTIKSQFYDGKMYKPCTKDYKANGFEDLNGLIKEVNSMIVEGSKKTENEINVFEFNINDTINKIEVI